MRTLRNIVYKSSNLIVQQLQEGPVSANTAVVVGSGHSVSVDDNNNVTFADPGFRPPKKISNYGTDCTLFTIYYPKTCEGLDAAVQELAEFINEDLAFYRQIILHGYCECGLFFLNLYHEQLTPWSKRRTHVVSVSAQINKIDLKSILEDQSEYKNAYKNNIHIVVSKPSDNPLSLIFQLISGCKMIPLKDQIPDINSVFIYDQITAFSAKSAMCSSCKFVRLLMQNKQ